MKAAEPEQVEEWKRQMVVAYEVVGTVTGACEQVGIPSIRHKRWMREDSAYRERFLSVRAQRSESGLATGKALSTGRPVDYVHRRGQQARFIAAYEECGSIDKAARQAGVALKQHYRWVDNDPEYTEKFYAAETRRRDAGLRVGRNYKPWSDESKAKARKARIGWWENRPPEAKENILAALRSGHQRIRAGGAVSSLEAALMTALNGMSVPYFLHYGIGPYTADVYVPSRKLDIEADGSWFHDKDERREHEAKRDAALAVEGVTVFRMSEAEIESGDFSRLFEALGVEV